jgi:branched-chain amino acid aminotransferase
MSEVWLNGALVPASAARIDPADRGFTLGDGLFETIRAADYAPAHAARHFTRMREGAAILRIPVPYTDNELDDALRAVLRANQLGEAALRMTLTRGPAARGVLPPADPQPTLLISAGPLPASPFAARLIVAQRTRRNEGSRLSRIKSLNYLDGIMALQEAFEAGADDALLLNTRGDLAEATAANVFLLLDGAWITPPVEDGALPGIARALLLEAGAAREATITRADLQRAEAGFLTNSLSTRPIARIGGRGLDTGEVSSSFLQKRTKKLLLPP